MLLCHLCCGGQQFEDVRRRVRHHSQFGQVSSGLLHGGQARDHLRPGRRFVEIMAGTNHCDTGLVRLPDEGRKFFLIREELDVKQIGTAADTDRAAEISVLLPRQGDLSALCFGAKGHEQEFFAQRCSQTGQHPLPCGSIQNIGKPVGPPLDAVGLQRG